MAKKKGKPSSKKEYNAFLDKIKKKLLKLREEGSENIESNLQDLQTRETHHLADADDLAADSTDDLLVSQILEMGASKLEKIERALEKIDLGSYGYCEECETFIGTERIKALPFTHLCIECKRKEEEGGGEGEED